MRWLDEGVVRRLLLLLLVMSSLAEMLYLHSLSPLDCWSPPIFSKGEILYPRPRQPGGEETWRRFCYRARPSLPGGSRAVLGDPAIQKISVMSTFTSLVSEGRRDRAPVQSLVGRAQHCTGQTKKASWDKLTGLKTETFLPSKR